MAKKKKPFSYSIAEKNIYTVNTTSKNNCKHVSPFRKLHETWTADGELGVPVEYCAQFRNGGSERSGR